MKLETIGGIGSKPSQICANLGCHKRLMEICVTDKPQDACDCEKPNCFATLQLENQALIRKQVPKLETDNSIKVQDEAIAAEDYATFDCCSLSLMEALSMDYQLS